jgi:hypothetical protein
MSTSSDPADAQPEDERAVAPEPARHRSTEDFEVSEADALEQAEEVVPGGAVAPPSIGVEVPEVDAWEQAMEVPLDDEPAGDDSA